ncbi:MAG TPA: transposase [Polyangiales bacterium]
MLFGARFRAANTTASAPAPSARSYRSYRRRAKEAHGLSSIALAQTGAVTVVQRTDSALRLSVHFHTILIDGVYVPAAADGGAPRFLPLPEPSVAEAQELAERVAARIERVLRKHGCYVDEQEGGDAEQEAPPAEQAALHACYEASALGQQLLGPSAGKPVLRLLGAAPLSAAGDKRGIVGESRGVNIHASASVHGRDKAQVERLCRYLMRPPLAQERLHELPDGRLQLLLRKACRPARARSACFVNRDSAAGRLCAGLCQASWSTRSSPIVSPGISRRPLCHRSCKTWLHELVPACPSSPSPRPLRSACLAALPMA